MRMTRVPRYRAYADTGMAILIEVYAKDRVSGKAWLTKKTGIFHKRIQVVGISALLVF